LTTKQPGKGTVFGVKELFLVVFSLLLLSSLLTLYYTITTNNASGQYLNEAMRYYRGDAPLKMDRGPVYPLLLAAGFALFGPSLESAFAVTQAFYVLSVVMVFLITVKLFGKWEAFGASSLIVWSISLYSENRTINLDFVLAAFLLVFLAFATKAHEEGRWRYFLLAGASLSVAYLTSEIALLYLPFPLLLVALTKGYRTFDRFRKTATLYLVFIVGVAPWALFLVSRDVHLVELLGVLSPRRSNSQLFLGDAGFAGLMRPAVAAKGLLKFYADFLARYFTLHWLFLVGWAFMLVQWLRFRREEASSFLLMGILYIPLLIGVGLQGDRLGHAVLFIYFCYIVSGLVLVKMMKQLLPYAPAVLKKYGRRRLLVVGGVIGTAILAALVVPGSSYITTDTARRYIRAAGSIRPVWSHFQVAGRHSKDIENAAKWLRENAPQGSTLYADGMFDDAFQFFSQAEFKVKSKGTPRYVGMHQLLDSGGDGSRGAGPKNAIIAVSNIPGKFRNPYRRYRNLYVILESDWSEYLGTVGVKGSYIVIVDRTKLRFPFLLEYLQTASWARRVYRENSIDIFEILESHRTGSLLPSPCNVLDTLRDDLRWLREEYPEEYRLMKRVLEEDKCGVDLARTPYLFDN